MTTSRLRAACSLLAAFSATPAFAVDISLFGDVNLERGNREEDTTTFRLGKLNLLINQDIDEQSRVNAEIVFEDHGHGIETEVERFAVTYLVNESLNIGAGRYHTPLGFWNHNFHHGMIVQDTVTRPFFLEIQGGAHASIFPTHIVGLLASGTTQRNDIGISYNLALANGPSIDTAAQQDDEAIDLDVNNRRDPTDSKSLLARVGFAPLDDNWSLGVSAMENHISESGEPVADPTQAPYLPEGEILFEQQIFGIDARYAGENYYLIAEYFDSRFSDNARFNNQRANITPNPSKYSGKAHYVQLGYTVSDKVGVAARVEQLKFDSGATYFALLGMQEQKRTVYALRYNLSDSNVLRFQRTQVEGGDESFTQYSIQWFYMLF